jgi:hypothetical protein
MGHHIKVAWFLISVLGTDGHPNIEAVTTSHAACIQAIRPRTRELERENPEVLQINLYCRPAWADDQHIPQEHLP